MSFAGRKNISGLRKGLRVLDREYDTAVSTVQVKNVSIVKNRDDLLRLIKNVLKQSSHHRPMLVKEELIKDGVIYTLKTKRSALTLARSIQNAFKHYHPILLKDEPNDKASIHISVTFVEKKK